MAMTAHEEFSNSERLTLSDEIRELMARYVRYADEKRWDDLARLFTPEGVFTPLDGAGDPVVRMTGREQIARIIRTTVSKATAIHHLFSYEIALQSAVSATGIFAMEDYLVRPPDEEPPTHGEGAVAPFRTMHGFGHYRPTFAKANGEWLITKMTLTRTKLDFT
jgi:hypothetical protein